MSKQQEWWRFCVGALSQCTSNYRRLPVNSSHTHTRLITQSTRNKRAHNKTTSTSTSRNYLHAVKRHPETVLNTDGVITAICYFNVYCRLQITATDYTSRKSTVNSLQRRETRRSTRHTILRCDELTVWRVDWFPYGRTDQLTDGQNFPCSIYTSIFSVAQNRRCNFFFKNFVVFLVFDLSVSVCLLEIFCSAAVGPVNGGNGSQCCEWYW